MNISSGRRYGLEVLPCLHCSINTYSYRVRESLPPGIPWSVRPRLRASGRQILCQLRFCFFSASRAEQFPKMCPSVWQGMHARMSACSRRLHEQRASPGFGDNIERYMNRPVVHDAAPAQYKPLLFHGRVISTPTKYIRFPTLRGFNLSHSKRRCHDHQQSAEWYVACGTPFL